MHAAYKALDTYLPCDRLPHGPLDLVQLQSHAQIVTEQAPHRAKGSSGRATVQLYSICLRASRVQDLLTGECKRGGCTFIIQSRQKADPDNLTAHTFTDVAVYQCNRGPADHSCRAQSEAAGPEQQLDQPKRKRKSKKSIKVGFSVREPALAPGLVVIKWTVGGTQHAGHGTEAHAAERGLSDLFPTRLSEACRAWAAQCLLNDMTFDAILQENHRRITCICPTDEELEAHPQLWRDRQLCKTDLWNMRCQQRKHKQQQQQHEEAAEAVGNNVEATATLPTNAVAEEAPAAAAAAPAAESSRQHDLQAEFDRQLADLRQLAGLSDELLAAAVPLLQGGCSYLRQRAAQEAEAGSMHPASQVMLTQLRPHICGSKRRRQPAWFGGLASKRPKQQEESAARARPWSWAGANASKPVGSTDSTPAWGMGHPGGSAPVKSTSAAAQPSAARQPLLLSAGGRVQQQPVPQPGCLPAPSASGALVAAAAAQLLQHMQLGAYAAFGPPVQPAPAQLPFAAPSVPPADMLQLFQALLLMGSPAAAAPAQQRRLPPGMPAPVVLQQLAALLAHQPTQQQAVGGVG